MLLEGTNYGCHHAHVGWVYNVHLYKGSNCLNCNLIVAFHSWHSNTFTNHIHHVQIGYDNVFSKVLQTPAIYTMLHLANVIIKYVPIRACYVTSIKECRLTKLSMYG